jgi:acetylornithine deacetylase
MSVPTAQHVAQWLARLVQIPSVSPQQAGPRSGVVGEARLAGEVAGWFRQFGGEVYLDEVLPGRSNVIGLWRGRSDRILGLDVHMDTVGVEAMVGDPFSGRIEGGKVFGRGTTDTKASLAIALALVEAMHASGKRPESTLLVAATVDEESGARGAPALAHWLRKRGMIVDQLAVAEPTLCRPVHGHKGVLRLRLNITGKAAHSSQPELGRSALAAGVSVAAAMQGYSDELARGGGGGALGPGTLMVTVFRAGESMNIVPPNCEIVIDRRLTTGESAPDERERLTALARRSSPLPVDVEVIHEINAFYREPDSQLARDLGRWSDSKPMVVPFCTNAWAYTPDVARECVVIGPGSIEQAHTDDEWIAISELEKLTAVYAKWWGIA